MSVLPQLERELSATHARRARRRIPRIGFGFGPGAAPVVLATAVAVAVVVVAVVALRSAPAPQQRAGAPAVVYRGFLSLPYAAGGSLYGIPSDRPDSLANTPPIHLVRIDPSSGQVVARQVFALPAIPRPGGVTVHRDPVPERILLGAGSLWITATDSREAWLWRLDPSTLAVRSVKVLPGGSPAGTGSLALAGGWLWLANGSTLIRVSPQTGRLAGSRPFSRIRTGLGSSVAADGSGRTLIATVPNLQTFSSPHVVRGDPGARVYRLDPHTGAPIAESATFPGSTPQLVGVLDGGAWINGFTAVGSPARVDLRTLKVTAQPRGFPAWVQVLGQTVQLAARGGLRCVDPVTGATLATLPEVVAAENRTAYIQVTRRGIPEIHREKLDPRCLGHR